MAAGTGLLSRGGGVLHRVGMRDRWGWEEALRPLKQGDCWLVF
jgi:hypothetical protein